MGEKVNPGMAVTITVNASCGLPPYPLRLVPDPSGRLRMAAASGVAGLDVIVETVATSVAVGNWSRLKLCSAADCRNKTRAYRSRRAS
jgi:hypothetical protein